MSQLIVLSPRLQLVAGFVRKGVKLADVGTDHAYLPAYLIKTGHIRSAIAADVRSGPLEKAKETLLKYGLDDAIEPRLSDGLQNILPEEADDIVMAGMGGELITALLCSCSWAKRPDKHFIFQPMTHSELLRSYLAENGFRILKEQCVAEGPKTYVILDAVFDGKPYLLPGSKAYTGMLHDFRDDANRRYLKKQIHYLTNKLRGGEVESVRNILKELTALYDNR